MAMVAGIDPLYLTTASTSMAVWRFFGNGIPKRHPVKHVAVKGDQMVYATGSNRTLTSQVSQKRAAPANEKGIGRKRQEQADHGR